MAIDKAQGRVVAVIVNWNAGSQLEQCLRSLQNECPAIVVDNASTDGSCDALSQLHGVTVIESSENLGFGKACNLGAAHVQADYVLFLNPDAALFPGTLERALTFMQDPVHAQVGICGVQLVDAQGQVSRSCARFPTAARLVAQAVGLDRLVPSLGLLMADWPHDRTKTVDHVIGAFFLMRRELFNSLGGFDERFFLYLEDLDFSYRARQIGWNSAYMAEVQAFHRGGGTSDQIKARRLFYILRSRLIYAQKHFSLGGMLVVLFATLFLEPISRSIQSLGKRSWSGFKEVWQGYAMLVRWLPDWIFKGVTR
jgi:GT2 family glycosyltransferase